MQPTVNDIGVQMQQEIANLLNFAWPIISPLLFITIALHMTQAMIRMLGVSLTLPDDDDQPMVGQTQRLLISHERRIRILEAIKTDRTWQALGVSLAILAGVAVSILIRS